MFAEAWAVRVAAAAATVRIYAVQADDLPAAGGVGERGVEELASGWPLRSPGPLVRYRPAGSWVLRGRCLAF